MTLKVGDKIRILEDRYMSARVFIGDILEVTYIYPENGFRTEAPRLTNITADWSFVYEDEGIGWEKVEVDQ